MTVKERPILFKGSMVNAILDGRKTMTRRVVKLIAENEHCNGLPFAVCKDGGDGWIPWYGKPTANIEEQTLKAYPEGGGVKCPYGKPGDILWVRHGTWYGWLKRKLAIFIPWLAFRVPLEITDIRVERLQDISFDDCMAEGVVGTEWWEAVSTDELAAIDNDGKAEKFTEIPSVEDSINQGWMNYARAAFIKLWDSINAKTYPWKNNCWVWVVEFKRIDSK